MASDVPVRPAVPELRPAFPCAGEDLAAARACEQAVFGRRFGNTAEELAVEYGLYEECTSFGAVFTADGTALGALRLIRPGRRRVKTLVDAAGPPWNVPERAFRQVLGGTKGSGEPHVWDVATFGVDSDVAGADQRIAVVLLNVMFGAFRDNRVAGFLAMLDSGARRAFRGLGVRMLDLPGAKPAPYLGSLSTVPVFRRVAELHAEHADEFPQLHQQVFHGRGVPGLDPGSAAPGSFVMGLRLPGRVVPGRVQCGA